MCVILARIEFQIPRHAFTVHQRTLIYVVAVFVNRAALNSLSFDHLSHTTVQGHPWLYSVRATSYSCVYFLHTFPKRRNNKQTSFYRAQCLFYDTTRSLTSTFHIQTNTLALGHSCSLTTYRKIGRTSFKDRHCFQNQIAMYDVIP